MVDSNTNLKKAMEAVIAAKQEARVRQLVSQDPLDDALAAAFSGEEALGIRTYGRKLIPGLTQIEYEFLSFKDHLGLQEAKCTRYENFQNICGILFPKLEWNPWLDKQVRSLCENDFVSWTGCAASGKSLRNDTRVMTPNGSIPIGEITTGQEVCTPDGSSAKVLGVYPQGELDIYEMTLADGTKNYSSADHLWSILDSHNKPRVVTTEWLVENNADSKGRGRCSIPLTKPVGYGHKEVPVDPYVLGILIGDGALSGRDVRVSLSDEPIRKRVIDYFTKVRGARVVELSKPIDFAIRSDAALLDALRALDLLGKRSYEKHIPREYLFNSVDSRMELLRGLMDSDGWIEKKGTSFNYGTTSPQLNEDFKFLVQSLGGFVRQWTKPNPKYTYKGETRTGRPFYQSAISVPHDMQEQLFWLPRKRESVVLSRFDKTSRTIRSIKWHSTDHATCIKVDHPNSLFLIDDFVVTHNTHTASLWAVIWWLADPHNSAVVLTSTTKSMLRKRAWSEVQRLYTTMEAVPPGNMVDSKTVWQASKGDEKNAIFGLAVRDGNTAAAVAGIQGIHTKRVLVIVDEATDTPQAIFDATANLFSGCEEFQMLAIGNPNSHYDPHGKYSEPLNGWESVTVDTEEWETKIQLNGQPGVCVRFDAERSPNIELGETKYPYLVTKAQLEGSRKKLGMDSPLFWKFQRGFWAPAGVLQTVFNETLLSKMRAHEGFLFRKEMKVIGACDPAFGGGDRAVIRFAVVGITEGQKVGIELEPHDELEIDAASSEPVHFQLASQIKAYCQQRGCEPHDFGIDASGEGGGLADILAKEWSPKIHRVEFGGKASTRPVSYEDLRPSCDVYDRKVTELWFSAREFLQAGQLRGIDGWTAKEFCSREFSDEKRKITLQTKRDMKAVYGASPDIADCTVILIDVARSSGINVFVGDHVSAQDSTEPNIADSIYDEIGDEFDYADIEV